MTAKDRYTETLKCPKCGRTGTAALWEHDGRSYDGKTRVTSLPDGFTAQQSNVAVGGLEIWCALCGVDARQ